MKALPFDALSTLFSALTIGEISSKIKREERHRFNVQGRITIPMLDKDKVIVYEMQLEDLIHTLQGRLSEMEKIKRDEFEDGRYLAYTEIMDIIKTRHKMIMDVISDE